LSSYEGIEGTVINIFDGNITVNATNDGINAADSAGTYKDSMDFALNILGGTVTVKCTQGDGLDSNGYVNLIGGTINITAMNMGGEAGIDYDGAYYVSDEVVLNNASGVSGPDMMPGGMGGFGGKNGQKGQRNDTENQK